MPAEFRLLGSRRLAEGRLLTFERRHYVAEGQMVREMVWHPGSVAVVPLIGEDVVLIRQHRTPLGEDLLELPAGLRDHEDEDPEVTARRECSEEIGYVPGRLALLHRFRNSAGFTDEETWLYLGEDLRWVGATPEGSEEKGAQVVRLPLSEALRLAHEGEIVDAKTLIGLLALGQRRD